MRYPDRSDLRCLSSNAFIVRRTENAGLVAIARLVFGELVMVLMVSLMFLIPNQQPLVWQCR